MAIYRLPPSPFVGGRQPLAPRDLNPSFEDNPPPQVDEPPSKFPIPILTAILIAWQPISVPLQAQRFVPQVVEEQVPFTRHSEIYNSWIVEPTIIQPRIFTPQVITEEQVAFTRHLEILNSWIEAQINPQLPQKLVQEFIPPPVDEPIPYSPRTSIIVSNWEEKLSFIQIRPFVPTVSETPTEFVPYLRPQLYITLIYTPYQIYRKIVQEGPVVNDPPFGQRIWLNQVLTSWIPLPIDFVYPIQLIQEFIPAPVDDPPFGRRVLWLNTVLDAWIPPPPPPWNPIDQFTPPTSDDIIIWLWKRVL